ncbi:hypothetical protein BpHYR1_050960 [Brachionus plicatilis]|uniref:Uncharacterized protein n=1 Tax=Brachionus plicatilis TaxID=10195 RepID=A0A3M7QXM6_BRAPC|nr:hypothetical protein BpHYR1_050960 [Brachionus plicatilis]
MISGKSLIFVALSSLVLMVVSVPAPNLPEQDMVMQTGSARSMYGYNDNYDNGKYDRYNYKPYGYDKYDYKPNYYKSYDDYKPYNSHNGYNNYNYGYKSKNYDYKPYHGSYNRKHYNSYEY